MWHALLAIPLSMSVAALAALYLLTKAHHWGLIDNPGGRKTHHQPTPLIGGLVIWAGMCTSLLLLPMATVLPMLVLSSATVGIGAMDDHHELSPGIRLLTHLVVGAAMSLWAGVSLQGFGRLLGGDAMLLGWLALPITCFAVAASMNAINMVDGVDGLAGSLCLLPVSIITGLSWLSGQEALLIQSLVILGGLVIFLMLNFPVPWRARAHCFLGDTGSTLLGLMVAWLLIDAASSGLIKPVTALYLLAIPLIDTAGVISRRLLRGVSVSTAGRDHLHHVLIDGGMPSRYATYLIIMLAVLIAFTGLLMAQDGVAEQFQFFGFVALLGANILALHSAEHAKSVIRARWFS